MDFLQWADIKQKLFFSSVFFGCKSKYKSYETENSAQTHKYKTVYLKNKASFCMSPACDNGLIFMFAAIFAS